MPCTQLAPAWHGGDRRGGGEAEVVVPVPVDGNLVVEPLHELADEERGCLRGRDPEGVDHDDLLCARLDRALVRGSHELEVGARRVDAEERDADALLDRERDRGANPLEHVLA